MFDGSEKSNRQLAFELHYSHVCEKGCKHNRTVRSSAAATKVETSLV